MSDHTDLGRELRSTDNDHPDCGSCASNLRRRAADALDAAQQVKPEWTAILFALEELSKWPDLPRISFGAVLEEPGKEPQLFELHPDKLKGVYEALRAHVKEVCPSAAEAMEAYYGRRGLESQLSEAQQEIARLTAKYERLEDAYDKDAGYTTKVEAERDALWGILAYWFRQRETPKLITTTFREMERRTRALLKEDEDATD